MALDHADAILAFRSRLLDTTVAATGSATLSATSTGYARTTGSFLDDDFAVGMEITEGTGFSVSANNQATTSQGRVITEVTATTISCPGCTAESVGAGRTITVGLPFQRSWDNVDFRPVVGFPYVDEDFVPASSAMRSFPYNGGQNEERGLYVVRLYGLAGKDVRAIYKTANAIKARFAAGTSMTVGSDAVRVAGQPGPFNGQVIPLQNGSWAMCVVTVPWWAQSTNLVAA